MSCNFNAINCKNCPKYNACLLQIVYTNTLSLATMIDDVNNKLDNMNKQINSNNTTFSVDDNIEMFSHLEDINSKLDNVVQTLENEEEQKNERTVDINNIQSSLSSIHCKLDDLIKSYNSYEYIPIINKDE